MVSEEKPPEGLRPWMAELISALPIIKRSYRSGELTEKTYSKNKSLQNDTIKLPKHNKVFFDVQKKLK
jgi:hypothetical protein